MSLDVPKSPVLCVLTRLFSFLFVAFGPLGTKLPQQVILRIEHINSKFQVSKSNWSQHLMWSVEPRNMTQWSYS